jgi:NADP-reducing hydrogenase subunit HndD
VVELILSNHDRKCLSCVRSQNCELQKAGKEWAWTTRNTFNGEPQLRA